ncbi:hypothetical protein THF1C08_30438 [Vibrio jasicida]|uniref:Uncharacterized protein n=1 Tax=Vibrio jasicida TaxID=766224 RepID=A0AAU9QK18_9VIBR|nr:hypothetical protein THF1A12_180006 [Vibrio jasicida]CAH1590784.1 hypothetical protein THF1C08_30438 [Vibrio jasicida]
MINDQGTERTTEAPDVELFHTQNIESLIQLQKIKLSQVFSLQYELSQPTIG